MKLILLTILYLGVKLLARELYDFFTFLISSFCIKLFTLELCHFFASLSVLLFREQVGKANLD
jgi:hypothetical protein